MLRHKYSARFLVCFFLTLAAFDLRAFDESLIAHWPMDEGAGDSVEDVSGNGYQGVLDRVSWARSTSDRDPRRWGAFFSGAGSITTGDFPVPDQFTITAWISPDESELENDRSDGLTIIGRHSSSGENVLVIEIVDESFRITVRDQSFSIGRVRAAWQHIVVTGETLDAGTRIAVYQNGVLIGDHLDNAKTEDATGGRPWIIGQGWDGDDRARSFNGTIDDVRIYDQALDAGQVTELFTRLCNRGFSNGEVAWVQVGCDLDGRSEFESFSASLSMSGDGSVIAVGAPGNDSAGENAGEARVYMRSGDLWEQMGNAISGAAPGDLLGTVALSEDGRTLAVGAPSSDSSQEDAGQVRVYTWTGTTWAQLGGTINGETAGEKSGSAISLSNDGRTLAIGAPFNAYTGEKSGRARVFRWARNRWEQVGRGLNGGRRYTLFGSHLELSGDGFTIAISSPFFRGGSVPPLIGYVTVHAWTGSTWRLLGVSIPGGRPLGDIALSDDGETMAVSAPWQGRSLNELLVGDARVYRYDGTNWNQLGDQIFGDRFSGDSLDLSGDGNILAIGSQSHSDGSIRSGDVRVYQWSGQTWSLMGPFIFGEAPDERFGGSVVLSHDGRTVGVGASNGNGGFANPTGSVTVLQLDDGPKISGNAQSLAVPGVSYTFVPTVQTVHPTDLSFSIEGKPEWATFNPSTGQLTGTPTAADSTSQSSVVISVTDSLLTNSLAPFVITVLEDTDGDLAPDNCDADCLAIGFLADLDDDGDGLSDLDELQLGTDPLNPDTDGDGSSDAEELANETDPLDAASPLTDGLPVWLFHRALSR
ncbi:MAG: LamG-like jellyroll fold domain-containing protein [Pseudomonadota bacterium]